MRLQNILIALVVSACMVVLTGCPRTVSLSDYNRYNTRIDSLTIAALDPVIQKNDILYISFSVPGTESAQKSVQIFNTPNFVGNNPSGGSMQSTLGYLVDPQGNINIPAMGLIKVSGLTKQQVVDMLKTRLRQYIQLEPIVTIRIINFKISIEGELQRPGVYEIPNERVTLLEAISMAGGLSVFAKKDDILIVRDDNGKKTLTHVDLRNEEIFTRYSDFYYLRQNDHIYVPATKEKALSSNQSTARNVSLAATAAGLLIAIFTLLRN
jgi:polysaccharide biosynthesis/export protein